MTAIDPICHMEVDESTALQETVDDQTWYFCSQGCRTKFLAQHSEEQAQPEPKSSCCHDGSGHHAGHHEQKTSAVTTPAGTIYSCPMHPEIEQVGPGSCPICGMDLVPIMPQKEDSPEEVAEYELMARRFWGGLALGFTISSFFELVLLLWLLRKKMGGINGRRLFSGVWRMVLACLVMGVVTWLVLQQISSASVLWQLLAAAFVGGITYLLASMVLGVTELQQLWGSVRRRVG